MAIRISDSSSYYQRSSALTLTSFTAMGWGYQVSDRGTNTTQSIFTGTRAIPTNADTFLNWEEVTEIMQIGSWDSVTTNRGALASRPSLGTWFHWYVTCSGSGANELKGAWRPAGSSIYVSATTTLAPNSTGTGLARIGAYSASSWGNIRLAAYKQYSTALSEINILTESFYYLPVQFVNLTQCSPILASSVSNGTLDYSANGNNFTSSGSPTIEEGPPIMWSKQNPKPLYKSAGEIGIAWKVA